MSSLYYYFSAFIMKPIVESQILVNLPIKNGSEVYSNWKDPPVHPVMFMKFFNLTNKDDFLNGMFLCFLMFLKTHHVSMVKTNRPNTNINFRILFQ